MTYLVFDLAILAVLLICAWRGASRGFVLSLCGLLAIVVAFAGASAASHALAPRVAEALEPRFAAVIEEKLDEQIKAGTASGDAPAVSAPEDVPLQDVLNVLKSMGFYEELIDTVNRAVEDGMLSVAAGAAAAVAAAIAQSVASFLIFFVVFVLILVVWSLLSHALDLVTRLPGLHFLNKTGGAVLGIVKGCAVLFVAAWLLQYLGHVIPEETVRQTHLLRFFMTTNPVGLLLGT